MRKIKLSLLVLAALTFGAAAAVHAFPDCGTCPTSTCDTTCQYCDGIDYPDGGCSNWAYKTCQDTGGCMRAGCTPSWSEQSSTVRGTYGTQYGAWCEHHTVEWVTEVDANSCNINSWYNTRSSCVDDRDGVKAGPFQDCCNGSPSSLFLCDHHHSC
jgi:hypothetical protein